MNYKTILIVMFCILKINCSRVDVKSRDDVGRASAPQNVTWQLVEQYLFNSTPASKTDTRDPYAGNTYRHSVLRYTIDECVNISWTHAKTTRHGDQFIEKKSMTNYGRRGGS